MAMLEDIVRLTMTVLIMKIYNNGETDNDSFDNKKK